MARAHSSGSRGLGEEGRNTVEKDPARKTQSAQAKCRRMVSETHSVPETGLGKAHVAPLAAQSVVPR